MYQVLFQVWFYLPSSFLCCQTTSVQSEGLAQPLSEVTLHVFLWEGVAVEEFSSLNLCGSVCPEILSHPSVQAWIQRRLHCSV